jgi:hypothetical protein
VTIVTSKVVKKRLIVETWTCQLKYENKAVIPRVRKLLINENILTCIYTLRTYLTDISYNESLGREIKLTLITKIKKNKNEVAFRITQIPNRSKIVELDV